MDATQSSPFLRVAHRGGSALAPENTLAAFRRALTFPIDALECDVQMSRDGHALVFHDETLERLSNGQGNFLDLDLAYLRSLNVATHFPGGWPEPVQMPTLREVLDLAREYERRVFLEIKPSLRNGHYGRYPGIVEAVTHDIQAARVEELTMVMSFDWAVLPLVQQVLPQIQTGILVSRDVWQPEKPGALPTLIAQAQALQYRWIHIDEQLLTTELVEVFHAQGWLVGTWTVNDRARIERAQQAGADALTTDRPDLFEHV